MPRIEREPIDYSGIFFDSADLEEFDNWLKTGVLGGATTNPVIVSKEGVSDVDGHLDKMVEMSGPGFPISIEIPDSRWSKERMIEEALRYRDRYPNNSVIKVPMDPEDPEKAFEVMYDLSQEGVRLNATLGLSMGQLVGASEAMRNSDANGDNYISLFWGRREEAKEMIFEKRLKEERSKSTNERWGREDEKSLRNELDRQVPGAAETLEMTLKYLKAHSLASKVIVGSIRNPQQIEQAFGLGADIVTIPPKLLREWMYTKRGVETRDQFDQAYRDMVGETFE